jgi:predicted acyl esterase
MRRLIVLVAAMIAVAAAPSTASADITSALGISCTTQGAGPNAGQRWCGTGAFKQSPNNVRSTVQSFDGVPIDVNVAFPSTGGDGPYPLVMMFHGYGGGKFDFPQMQRWLNKGYAVFSMTNRGFHESCGTTLAQAADTDCPSQGFVRLDDTRYEVRDAQLFAGMLVDAGLVQPTKIAATGGSYGGGMAMALAALKDRTMMPDGTLVPWTSPVNHTAMSLAVAIPDIPWTDLAYALAPNGSNIDYVKDASYTGRFGVMKQSFVNGLYLSGVSSGEGYYTAPGVQPSADLTGWKTFLDQGEPYDGTAEAAQIKTELETYHSSYAIDHSEAPAPLMISSGFSDDLFPANEATRFYNRTKAQYPNTPLALFFGDFGHMRAQNKADVTSALTTQENSWVDYYLSGTGTQPASNVTTYTETCPSGAASGGPFVTSSWAAQSPGEIRLDDDAAQTVAADGGDRTVGSAFNPVTGTACAAPPGAKETGTANYELAAAPAGGFTMMGSPTVIAKITQAGANSQIAARLVDVAPGGATKTLVDRALWRPANSGFQVFQLNPNGWKVEQGHVLRLELLPSDSGGAQNAPLSNYGRPSNDQQPATIEDLELRVPVVEAPGALGGLVQAPAKKVLPNVPGVELAPDLSAIGSETLDQFAHRVAPCPSGTTGVTPPDCVGSLKLAGSPTVKGRKMALKIKCTLPAGTGTCKTAGIVVKATGTVRAYKKPVLARGSGIKASPGKSKKVKLKLTHAARKLFGNSKKHGKVVKGVKSIRAGVKIGGKSAGVKTVRRVGKVH